MSATPRFEVDGLDTFIRTARKAEVDLSELKEANYRAGEIVADAAATRAPRRTGKLAASVRSARQLRRTRITAGRASVPYAAPIHWGWPARGIDANSFISNAARATESVWLPEYRKNVEDALAKIHGA